MKSVRISCPVCLSEVEVPSGAARKKRVGKKTGRSFVIVHMTCPKCLKAVQFSALVKEST